jgi:hypothetical protein
VSTIDVYFTDDGAIIPGGMVGIPESYLHKAAFDRDGNRFRDLQRRPGDYFYVEGRIHVRDGLVPIDMSSEVAAVLAAERAAAIQRLDAAYFVRMSGEYKADDKTSLPLAAAPLLANFLPMAPVMIGAGRGADTVGADVPGVGRIVLTWQQIAEHAGPFAFAVADVQSWYQKKRTEIEASDDPASVTL